MIPHRFARPAAAAVAERLKGMAADAREFSSVPTSDAVSAKAVLSMRHCLEMPRIDAASITAEVVQFETRGDRAAHLLVKCLMSSAAPLRPLPYGPVSAVVVSSKPAPAGKINGDAAYEPRREVMDHPG